MLTTGGERKLETSKSGQKTPEVPSDVCEETRGAALDCGTSHPGREKGRRAQSASNRKIQPLDKNRARRTSAKCRTLPGTGKNQREENLKGK